jgi:rubrerythrin
MNSLFENRNAEGYETMRSRLANVICPECGYVSSHTVYPRCSWRDGYEATGNPFLWRD